VKRLAFLLPLMAFGLALVGCAGGGGSQSSTSAGPTNGPRPMPLGTRPLVVPVGPEGMRVLENLRAPRFLSPRRLALFTAGSSNCPSAPARLVVETPHAIRIDLAIGSWLRIGSSRRMQVRHRPPGGVCLQDLVTSPVVVAIDPKRIDVHHRLRVSLYYRKGVIRSQKRPVVFTAPPLSAALGVNR
jgi:hypothetical protein